MARAKRNDGQAAKRWGITKVELRQRRAAGLKGCRKCRMWMPSDNYSSDASRADGLQAVCRHCMSIGRRK